MANALERKESGGNQMEFIRVTAKGRETLISPRQIISICRAGSEFAGQEVVRTEKSTASESLKIWMEKLEFLRQQEAITNDPGKKFELQKEIKIAQEKIRELGE